MVDILLLFSQVHNDFRLPEFLSICELYKISIQDALDAEKFLQATKFKCLDDVLKILSRSMLLKSAYEIYAESESHDDVIDIMKNRIHLLERFNEPSSSWALKFASYGQKRDNSYRTSVMERYAGFITLDMAPIDLKAPREAFFIIEENAGLEIRRVYFCRHVDYDIKKRKYIGNSTMDPELAFIQANLALCHPDMHVLDPFCGTGGLLLSASHFGSLSTGIEISYQVARAVGKSSRTGEQTLNADQSIRANFKQYGIEERFVDVLLADSSRDALWRMGGLFDAIVTDPPYGIREKGQKLGSGGNNNLDPNDGSKRNISRRYPEKTAYNISSVYLGLLNLAAKVLRIGGRLTFWFPVLRNEYSEDVLPQHMCMRRLYNCEQILTKESSRRLLVYEKMSDDVHLQGAFFSVDCYETESYRSKVFHNNNSIA